MKFRQYLNESDNLYDIIDMIKNDCKPFLKEIMPIFKRTGGWLYRGMTVRDNFSQKEVRQSRMPMSTEDFAHNYIDDQMYRKFGIKGRTNTVFCSLDDEEAWGYGDTVCLIFPIGQYKYLWSPKVNDATLYIGGQVDYKWQSSIQTYINFISDKERAGRSNTQIINDIIANNEKILDKMVDTYKTTGLSKSRGHEIMVQCRSYYYISDVMKDTVNDIFRNL